jgi:hypothetical protein
MNWKIMKGICWMNLEMGFTLKFITRKPSILGVTFGILMYLTVYIYFPLFHWLGY